MLTRTVSGQQSRSKLPQQPAPRTNVVQTPQQARAAPVLPTTPNAEAVLQNASQPYPSSALSSVPDITPACTGPVVVVKQRQVNQDESKPYAANQSKSLSQQVAKDDVDAAALKPHEREIADRKFQELESFVGRLLEDKEDPEDATNFSTVQTSDGELIVIKPKAMDNLSDKIANIINLGRFSALSVELVNDMQSILQPTIASTTKNDLFVLGDAEIDWSDSINTARIALKASKMVLDTMIEGRDDYRIRREETIDAMIDLIKFIKEACIVPVVQARRSGASEALFETATSQRQPLQTILRLCGSVISRFANLIGKYNLSDRALNTLEYLALELLMEQNSDSEKDSVFGIQKYEQFRQRSVDVLAQIFARHAEQRNSILNGILSNLEKLPDKKASARHFKSAREVPIMTISALFMRFVQVAATNREVQKPSERAAAYDSAEEDGNTSGSDEAKKKKKKQGRETNPSLIAQRLAADARNMAAFIVASLCDRASNVSKTGDKPFRNLLDLFIEDFCNVFGSPEWPAADMLLQQLLVRLVKTLQGDQAAKHSVVDKDMALATMATISCGVMDFKHRIKNLKREDLDISQSDLSSKIDRLVDEALNEDVKERIHEADLLDFEGPYRIVVESLRSYLDLHSQQEDPHHASITGCHITMWLTAVKEAYPDHEADSHPLVVAKLKSNLEQMIMDDQWLSRKL